MHNSINLQRKKLYEYTKKIYIYFHNDWINKFPKLRR